jgi:signal transduction histidine kinase
MEVSAKRAGLRWAVVPAMLVLATAGHAALQPALHLVPFMLYHAANFVSAWTGGLWPGLSCTIAGAVIVNALFLGPASGFALSPSALVATGVFMAIGCGVSLLCESRLAAIARAEQALAVREDFLAVAAHELRTPLTTIGLRLQRLFRRSPPEDQDDLSAALRQAARMDGLVHGLLDAVRLQQARIELDRAFVDLADLAIKVAAKLALKTDPPVHIEASPVVGRWDPARLEHVVANLLLNALKFGRGQPIQVKVARSGDLALLSVRDHGIGIAAKDQERIFERYERAVSVRHYGGLGLGLWIAREFVHAHGGSIRVESAAGSGSTFTVELPIQAPA